MTDAGRLREFYSAIEFDQLYTVEHMLDETPALIYERNQLGQSPLMAARGSEREVGEFLLARGAEVAAIDVLGRTALHCAASVGNKEIVSLLLGAGARIDYADQFGLTALFYAAQRAHDNVSGDLLAHGATIDLGCASALGRVDIVRDLLVAGRKPEPGTAQTTVSPLHAAARRGHAHIADLLVAHGFDVNARDPDELARTPLHLASLAGAFEVASVLLQKGAAVDLADSAGATALQIAARAGFVDVASLLTRYGAVDDILVAAEMGDVERVKFFLEGDPKGVNRRDSQGLTPLHCAAILSNITLIQTLLESGSAVDAVDKTGTTPLHYAVSNGQSSVVKLLLTNGANPNTPSLFALPLHQAVRLGSRPIVEDLVGSGADLSSLDPVSRQTPLHVAVAEGNDDMVRVLLRFGAPANAPNFLGQTPLELARTLSRDSIAALLEDGALKGAQGMKET